MGQFEAVLLAWAQAQATSAAPQVLAALRNVALRENGWQPQGALRLLGLPPASGGQSTTP